MEQRGRVGFAKSEFSGLSNFRTAPSPVPQHSRCPGNSEKRRRRRRSRRTDLVDPTRTSPVLNALTDLGDQ